MNATPRFPTPRSGELDQEDTISTPPPSARLYTPAEAAKQLAVKESWLRRKAGLRAIPCTFLGKHLRFSEEDLRDIISDSRSRTVSSPYRR